MPRKHIHYFCKGHKVVRRIGGGELKTIALCESDQDSIIITEALCLYEDRIRFKELCKAIKKEEAKDEKTKETEQ